VLQVHLVVVDEDTKLRFDEPYQLK
jgi:hypothetical protein